jgi:LacI family transcriptional regulator
MGITLQQIAEMAGTTKSTVDKVIHERPGVSEKKRQEIKKLLKEHGYEANPLAKALNYQKRKMRVAVVLPQITAAPDIKKGISVVYQDFHSFNIQVDYYEVGASDAEAQAACIRQLAEENVSGALILPIRSAAVEEAIGELLKKKIPVVIVNSELQLDGILCYVGQNMLQSGSVAVRMMDLFLKEPARIGIISCHNMLSHEQRERSFVESLAQGSGAAGSEVLQTRYIEETPEDAYQQTMDLLRDAPTLNALFITCGCVTDICRAVQDYRRDHPGFAQPVIICYEKYKEIRDLLQKRDVACTLTGGLTKQGRFSMRVLFEYLVYDRMPEKKAFFFNNKIMIRENS